MGVRASPHEAKPTIPCSGRSAIQVAAPAGWSERRRRHTASLLRPTSRAITASGRMPAYVVRQLSRCTCAIVPASAGFATRTSRGAAMSGNALDRGDDVLGVDAEEFVDVRRGRRFAEAVDADHFALEAHVL